MKEANEEAQLAIVKPILKAQDALTELASFENMKARLLVNSDYQLISGKNFIKKSGWRKLALVFNISDQIMESSKVVREDGSFVWSFRVRAQAPNGRFSEAVASCDSKERKFTHLEHDVQATAQTRAKSRAISDLIGAGEVTAEEMTYDSTVSPHDDRTPSEGEPTEEEKRKAMSLIHSAKEISRMSADDDFQASQSTHANKEISAGAKRFEFMTDQLPYPVYEDESPLSRFFLGKICKDIVDKDPNCFFELERDGHNRISAIVWYNIDENQGKNIERTLAWSLRKVAEKRRISSS